MPIQPPQENNTTLEDERLGTPTGTTPTSQQEGSFPESTSRRTRSLAVIYEICNFAIFEPESFEVAARQEVWVKVPPQVSMSRSYERRYQNYFRTTHGSW